MQEIIIKGITNNNVRTIQFPISKEALTAEIEALEDSDYLVISISIDGKNIFRI